MAVFSVQYSDTKYQAIPCQLVVYEKEAVVLFSEGLSFIERINLANAEITPVLARLMVKTKKNSFYIESLDILGVFRALRHSGSLFKTRINLHLFTVKVLPEYAVFESRSEKVVIYLDTSLKLNEYYSELAFIKGDTTFKADFETVEECQTVLTLLRLAKNLQGPPIEQTDLSTAFSKKPRTKEKAQQVRETDMVPQAGQLLEPTSFIYEKTERKRGMLARFENSTPDKPRQAQSESKCNESISSAFSRRRRTKKKAKKQLSETFDDTSIIIDANNEEEGYCQDQIANETFDEPESIEREEEEPGTFFERPQGEVNQPKREALLQIQVDNSSSILEQPPAQVTAKHIEAPNEEDAEQLERELCAQLLETPMFEPKYSSFGMDEE